MCYFITEIISLMEFSVDFLGIYADMSSAPLLYFLYLSTLYIYIYFRLHSAEAESLPEISILGLIPRHYGPMPTQQRE